MMKHVLVTGGCGYIGSHTVVDLLEKGFKVSCFDNFSRSKPEVQSLVERISGKKFDVYNVDLCDKQSVHEQFAQLAHVDAVIHFAAFKTVPESVEKPLMYYDNNISGLINLLEAAVQFKVEQFVFSSSCSVYGEPDQLPVTEDTPMKSAESPYAHTKQLGEEILQQIQKHQQAFRLVILRYFNPVGAHPSGKLGELPIGTPNNLVPFITQTAIGKRAQLTIFGNDYPTRDGTCIRDYIHVMDIAGAHTDAIMFAQKSMKKGQTELFNLGSGAGVTVLEAVQAFEKVNQLKLNYVFGPRRQGDVIQVFASNEKAKKLLGWRPSYYLEDMMRSAWKWEQFLIKLF